MHANERRARASARWHILGTEMRARRVALGLTLRSLARAVGLSPSTLSLAERGGPVIGSDVIGVIACELLVDAATRERWASLAGHIPVDITDALAAHPEMWRAVRALLGLENP